MNINVDENFIPGHIVPIRPHANYFVSGISPAMRSLERVITDIASTDIPILLIGESGTGKEVIALEIHRRSHRSNEAFLKCNCAGLAVESLMARLAIMADDGSETVAASGGTVFLDEVSQLDLARQSRLLRLLPDGDEMTRGTYLGARIISATTRSLEDQMRGGRFREELYYRINGVSVRLPALRHRSEDIAGLLDFFLKKYASLFGRAEPRLGTSAMDLLMRHSWPGNIRELENFARKMVALGDEQLALSDLTASAGSPPAAASSRPAIINSNGTGSFPSLKEAAREASRKTELEMISKVLERTHWNRKRTARELQISYKALLYKLKQLGLNGASDSKAQQ